MAIEKKLICFARLEEFERQLAAGNIKDYSIILIQDAKKIYNRGTYYDCSGITQEQGDERYLRKITEGDMTVSGIDQIRNPFSGMTYAFFESGNGNEDGIILTSDITKTINGQSLLGVGDITIEGGSADNVYITDFTVNDLRSIAGRDQESIQCQTQLLYDAVVANKIILVPYDAAMGFQGYGVAVGYCEDMIYLTILLGGEFIDLELDFGIDEINGSQVGLRGWYDKQNKLVSGTNIKTINGQSILGSGNIWIQGGEMNVNSDWLEPDNTVDSYVKNRTHYLTGTKITSAGSYSIGTSTPIYYKEKRYNLEIGVRTQIDTSAAGVYVTLSEGGVLNVEDVANLLGTYPIMAIYGVMPLDDMFIPETIARISELKTINGESIVGSGDLTIEGGAKIYTWSPTITSIEDTQISGTFTEEEYYNILNADVLYINIDGESVFCIARGVNSENGEGIRITGSQITTYADFAIDIFVIKEDGVFTGTISEPIPSKTSQLENDSNFITSDGLKTINGESIVGSGDITISGGSLTESDIAAMGFTKNTGTYSKPSGGIPKSDLASAVQTSLGKADTALQSYTEQYKGTITGVSANGTSVATSGVANIPAASTSAYGVTKLSSATNSTSTTLAATASAVKAAYDLASGKASMSDVNTAIANAITTTLNTAV